MYISILKFYDSVNRQPEIEETMDLELVTSGQVEKFVELYISLNLTFGFNLVQWENIF